ncbi:pre-toxin TG domain-containing protein [Calidithermus terrae]|uniref:pre-toxin TG domain-containing protein n=1 Tax=Calidithermus terrae TaxID=1408545 RepID=UPI003B84B4AF
MGGAAAFAAGFIPLVSTITGIYGAITGTDLFSGQQLGTTDRVLGVVPFGRIAKVLKSADTFDKFRLLTKEHWPTVPSRSTGNPPASAPHGKRGFPIEIPRGTNSPATINGIDYSGHALDQMQRRGITPSVVEEAVAYGIVRPAREGTWEFYDAKNGISVIVSSTTSKIITVITR